MLLSVAGSDQELRHRLDGLLRRRKADAQWPRAGQRRQPLERYGKVAAAFARGNSMNLVDDDGARGRQHDAPGFGAEQDIERLRSGDDDMRRATHHLAAIGGRGIAGPYRCSDLDIGEPHAAEGSA